MRIAVVAPSSRFRDIAQLELVERGVAGVAERFPGIEIVFHRQCRLPPEPTIHFAGTDRQREDALVEVANDPSFGAVWFARGGYGSNRIAEAAIARFGSAAREKAWLGYSDAGFLLAALYRNGFENVAHGPMPKDVLDEGGDVAIARALAWLARRDPSSLEGELTSGGRHMAFNITVLAMLLGTQLEPDFSGHELLLEDLSEYLYATDRALFHIGASAAVRRCAGIRMGRIAVKPNPDQPFGSTAEAVVEDWCERAGIRYRGRADIGHDPANKVVPFGPL